MTSAEAVAAEAPSETQLEIVTADGQIVGSGWFGTAAPPAGHQIVDPKDPSELVKLEQPGTKYYDTASGVITVIPPVPPIVYVRQSQVGERVRTTDATPLEVFRFACDPKHVYEAQLTIIGVDAGNGAVKSMEGRFVWKRWAAGAVMTGITVVSDLHDAAAASWAPNALPQGNDIVFTVAGAAGRTIDWLLAGAVSSYAPEGA